MSTYKMLTGKKRGLRTQMCVKVHMHSPIFQPSTKSVVGGPGNPNALISEVQTFFS